MDKYKKGGPNRRPSSSSKRNSTSSSSRPTKFSKSTSSDGEKRSFRPKPEGSFERKSRFSKPNSDGEKRSFTPKPEGSFGRKPRFSKFDAEGGAQRSFKPKPEGGYERKSRFSKPDSDGEKRSFRPKPEGSFVRKPRFSKFGEEDIEKRSYKPIIEEGDDLKSRFSKPDSNETLEGILNSEGEGIIENKSRFPNSSFEGNEKKSFKPRPKGGYERKPSLPKKFTTRPPKIDKPEVKKEREGIRLNKYIANAGICSRREADDLIVQGLIKVNGKVVDQLGYIVKLGESVKYGNKVLNPEKMVYVLLNKPKDFITTTNDPQERNTVMNLIKNACKERVYPVGRLDRNTTGLLLFTNDGELTEKLTHPSFKIKKIYQVELNRALSPEDGQAILDGLYFEEGKAVVDSMAILDSERKTIGIEVHIGWNRIVRRIFEAKGYDVERLDRVSYAGLTKKDLTRGNYRILSDKEVIMLKHFV